MIPTIILAIIGTIILGVIAWHRKPKCPECGSRNLDKGHWTRGWNTLCSQAAGDDGTRCDDCGHIQWSRSLDEYEADMAKHAPWVLTHRQQEALKDTAKQNAQEQ